MKLTKNSKKLLSFFMHNNCINYTHPTKKINTILLKLYSEIKSAEEYSESLKSKKKCNLFYNIKVEDIHNVSQIPKPSTFPADGFPPQIRKHIDEFTMSKVTYQLYLLDRKVTIYFLLEDVNPYTKVPMLNNYVDNMLLWLVILDQYASKECASELSVYIYLTSQEKNMPATNISVLDEHNVNTAFTMTCPKISEIVIFRKEEWFKVFLHETFHNFGLDFSAFNNDLCNKRILSIFPVKSEVNLFEAYSETWAKIMNACFCSYRSLSNKSNYGQFVSNFYFFINFERMFCYFQMVKVLDFMNLTYQQLFKKGLKMNQLRDTFYKEKTNVLSYYVITIILLNSFSDFMLWCESNNLNLLQFKKTTGNQDSFCLFIEERYKAPLFLKNVRCTEIFLHKIKTNGDFTKFKKDSAYILKNLRMTVCELG